MNLTGPTVIVPCKTIRPHQTLVQNLEQFWRVSPVRRQQIQDLAAQGTPARLVAARDGKIVAARRIHDVITAPGSNSVRFLTTPDPVAAFLVGTPVPVATQQGVRYRDM